MKLTVKVVSLLTIVIILFMIPAMILIWGNQQATITQQARARALTLYQMIVVTRQWVAENRDRIVPVPAVATKELSQYANYMADFKFGITSDKLINPENKPSEFEKRAITALRSGATEYSERGYERGMEGNVYRFAAPLIANSSCMPCHSFQGYHVGDFRGLISIIIPLKDLEISVRENNKTLIATVLIGVLLIVSLVSLLLYKLVLAPINMLTAAAGKIRNGDYNLRTAINTNDEIQELSEAFDTMSAQIAKNEDNLKSKLSEAVSKYIELVDTLKNKNEQLGTLNQLKTDLLDSIAHEIRTPLTKVMSYSELLGDPRIAGNEKDRERFTAALKRNIASISSMFSDIITMSRLEHGQHTYHKIPISIKELVSSILETHEEDINNKQLSIETDIKAGATILADGESFYYVLSNVLSNAIKYSLPQGTLKITVKNEDGHSVITVLDEGVGIPAEDLDNITVRFYRGSNVKNEYPGTGLGLSIVFRVVREHGGTISINSELNKYTLVTIRLPLADDIE